MLSCEIKVNGTMIGHIYARNVTGSKLGTGNHAYIWEYYKPESRSAERGHVTHKREDGIEKLISLILKEIK